MNCAWCVKEREGETMTTYEDKMAARQAKAARKAERFATFATNAQARSDSAFKRVDAIGEHIPMGQPILVGHHSEKRHRADIARMDNGMRAGIDEGKKASEWARRAEANARLAAGDHITLAFAMRRKEEAEAELRRLLRAKWTNEGPRKAAAVDEQRQGVAYWTNKITELGGVQFGPHNIKKGDIVRTKRDLYLVERVNAKSISHRYFWSETYSTLFTTPYAEIIEVTSPTKENTNAE